MSNSTWHGKIYIDGIARAVTVSVGARNSTEAKKMMEAQYGTKFKRWANQPRKDRPFG